MMFLFCLVLDILFFLLTYSAKPYTLNTKRSTSKQASFGHDRMSLHWPKLLLPRVQNRERESIYIHTFVKDGTETHLRRRDDGRVSLLLVHHRDKVGRRGVFGNLRRRIERMGEIRSRAIHGYVRSFVEFFLSTSRIIRSAGEGVVFFSRQSSCCSSSSSRTREGRECANFIRSGKKRDLAGKKINQSRQSAGVSFLRIFRESSREDATKMRRRRERASSFIAQFLSLSLLPFTHTSVFLCFLSFFPFCRRG